MLGGDVTRARIGVPYAMVADPFVTRIEEWGRKKITDGGEKGAKSARTSEEVMREYEHL